MKDFGLPIVILAVTVGYNAWVNRSALTGRILFYSTGYVQINPTQQAPILTLFAYLANAREIPVTPVVLTAEYQILKDGNGPWTTLRPIYWPRDTETVTLAVPMNGQPTPAVFNRADILNSNLAIPILRDRPRGGLLTFIAPDELRNLPSNQVDFRLTLVDAFGREHEIGREWRSRDVEGLLAVFPNAKLRDSAKRAAEPASSASPATVESR